MDERKTDPTKHKTRKMKPKNITTEKLLSFRKLIPSLQTCLPLIQRHVSARSVEVRSISSRHFEDDAIRLAAMIALTVIEPRIVAYSLPRNCPERIRLRIDALIEEAVPGIGLIIRRNTAPTKTPPQSVTIRAYCSHAEYFLDLGMNGGIA